MFCCTRRPPPLGGACHAQPKAGSCFPKGYVGHAFRWLPCQNWPWQNWPLESWPVLAWPVFLENWQSKLAIPWPVSHGQFCALPRLAMANMQNWTCFGKLAMFWQNWPTILAIMASLGKLRNWPTKLAIKTGHRWPVLLKANVHLWVAREA